MDWAGQLVKRWREEAALFRHRGVVAYADLLESCVTELEQRAREHGLEGLTLEQAIAESGHTSAAWWEAANRQWAVWPAMVRDRFTARAAELMHDGLDVAEATRRAYLEAKQEQAEVSAT